MRRFFFILLLGATVSSCKKADSGTVQLSGIDFRKCASPFCGGWFFSVDGQTLRFLEKPANTDIDFDSNLEFPINVEATWHKYDGEWGEISDLVFMEKMHKTE